MTTGCIEQWRNSYESFSEILKNSPDAESTIGKAILALLLENGNNYEKSPSRKLAQQIFDDQSKSVEINLYAFFLIAWVQSATKGYYFSEAKLILNKLEEIDSTLLFPETQSTILTVKGFYLSANGDFSGRLKCYNKAIKIKNLNKIKMESVLVGYQAILSIMGLAKNLDNKYVNILSNSSNNEILKQIKLNALFSSGELFQWNDTSPYIEMIEDKEIVQLIGKNRENDWRELKMFSDFFHDMRNYPFQKNIDTDINLNYFENWTASTGYLYTGNPNLGLKWAREYMLRDKSAFSRNLRSYTLIRAEVSNKNCEAAKKLLLAKSDMGFPHFFDHFFYARITLIENNNDLANKHIAELHKACKHYDAFGRLDFEISLACELSVEKIALFLNTDHKITDGFNTTNTPRDNHQQNKKNGLIVGVSPAIKLIKSKIKNVSKNKGIVLILGETGVGKEIVAKAIHESKPFKNKPFIAINCGSITDSLLQSELFGHVAGSFTGAYQYQAGVFESADDGIVFLDEIGEMSEQIQVALLRVLEKREVRPVGSSIAKKIKCKIITATNKNLKEMVMQKKFREDLYYRLNQFLIELPPLRERKDDIILLAKHFLNDNRIDGKTSKISNGLEKLLRSYNWPGNVRQLKNEIEKLRWQNSEKLLYEENDLSDNLRAPKQIKRKVLQNKRLDIILQNEKGLLRRRERMIDLFEDAEILTKSELIKMLKISPGTARTDLNHLETLGVIERIKPSLSTKSHYFKFRSRPKDL